MDVNEQSISRKPRPESVSLHRFISENQTNAEPIVRTVRETILILTPDQRVV